MRLSYTFRLTKQLRLELNAGVKNLFDSYQRDLDFGPSKDSAYIYGPCCRGPISWVRSSPCDTRGEEAQARQLPQRRAPQPLPQDDSPLPRPLRQG